MIGEYMILQYFFYYLMFACYSFTLHFHRYPHYDFTFGQLHNCERYLIIEWKLNSELTCRSFSSLDPVVPSYSLDSKIYPHLGLRGILTD